jgi:crotonobetainyl-CoA:carnitine CoA-transferase CaiB-like acyl-CoA transferase
MLSPYRVLDLTCSYGQLAGQILAWLGAEVIAVEPPGGIDSRHRGPFAGDVHDVDRSLGHWAFNRGKRSVVLDLAGSAADRDELLRLASGADVLIESARPGAMGASGLAHEDLAALNPALVYASISPFGQDGPKAGWAATDLTAWAAAGPLILTGDDDRPPVEIGVPQAFHHAAAEAAGAIVAALLERNRSGLGQHLDISAQLAAMQATQSAVLAVPNGSTAFERSAGSIMVGPLRIQLMWPCKDGFVSVTFLFGSAIGPATRRLMEWAHEEGFCDEATRDKDWIGYTELLLSGEEPVEEFDRVKGVVTALCASKTVEELLAGAMERRLLIAPVAMIDDVVASPQLAARDYWDDVGGHRFPGPFARCSATPLRPPDAAPRLGADTEAVRGEPARAPAAGSADSTSDDPQATAGPLAGLKVLDFMWVMAGPAASRVLADLGATVVRVESNTRIETGRTLAPFKDQTPGLETSVTFGNLNAGKLDLTLDLSNPRSIEVVHDLVRWADVVTESFSPRAMRQLGLDYEQLRAVNPSIVMASSCLWGQDGPLAEFAGFGTMAAAMSGFFGLTGWPDRPPCGPYGAYTDYISPRFFLATVLAAVDHQRRTGEGQYIDFAQAEASLHTLGPAILEYTVNGRVPQRRGNRHPHDRPSGVFPAAGDDRWVAVACRTDEQRAALEAIVGSLDDDAIAVWTAMRSPDDACVALQAVGVPAHPAQRSGDMLDDPQLRHLDHFRRLPHPELGDMVLEGPRVRYSRTPAATSASGPTIGQHSEAILKELLGYDDERFVDYVVAGAIG